MTPADLELIEAYIDDCLPESEINRLNELLRHNPTARAYLRSMSTVDSGMRDLAFSPSEARQSISWQDGDLVCERPVSARRRKRQARSERPLQFFQRRTFIAAAAVIAGIAVILSLLTYNVQPPEQYVATVERVSSEARLSSPVVLGERVGMDPIEIESGELKLRFDSGALVSLSGPARFVPVNERGGILFHGLLHGKAPKDRRGVRIVGPNFDVTDLGTEFALNVTQAQGAELYVIEGSVALQPQAGERITVQQNNGYHISASNQVSALSEDQIRDVFGKVLVARRDPFGVITPETVAYFSFAGSRPDVWRELITNKPIPADLPAEAETDAALMVDARTINLDYRQEYGKEFHKVFSSSLLIDSPMSVEARIFVQNPAKDAPFFTVHQAIPENRKGWAVSFEEGQDNVLRPAFWHYNVKKYEFPEVSLPLGRWVHFIFTVDDTAVRLYIDGNFAGESLRVGPMKFHDNNGAQIQIAGDRGPNRSGKLYSELFKGKIDYIAIHRRVLTPQEIQRYRPAAVR